jgi:hypothetical protein
VASGVSITRTISNSTRDGNTSNPAPATRVPPELYQAPAANAAVANDQDPYIAEVAVPRHSQPINQGLPAVFQVPRRC